MWREAGEALWCGSESCERIFCGGEARLEFPGLPVILEGCGDLRSTSVWGRRLPRRSGAASRQTRLSHNRAATREPRNGFGVNVALQMKVGAASGATWFI